MTAPRARALRISQRILRLLTCAGVLLISSCLAFIPRMEAQTFTVPLSPEHMILSQRNFKIPDPRPVEHNWEMVDYLGRQSFHLGRGLAYAKNVEFQDGTIDVDMAVDDGVFMGVAFRVQSDDAYEVIFFRPGGSGTDQAVQYTPAFLGANIWQIYTGPGYTAVAQIPRHQWIHVRIVVAGLVAKLYLNNAAEPSLVVPDLKLGHSKGSIGFWGHMGGGYFSNLSVTPDHSGFTDKVTQNFLSGTLTNWELSPMFDVSEKTPEVYPDMQNLTWEKVEAENSGMVVINRYRRSPNIDVPERAERIRGPVAGSKVVFARTTVHSDQAVVRKMNLAYSDEVVVYLNGKPVYSGNNTLGFRQHNFIGLFDPYSDALYLPLNQGDNELVLAVTEFFGGWGFMCKLAP
jgi:hypothetical protein